MESSQAKHINVALIVSVVIIELVSGFTQGYYEPLIPKFGEVMGVDASGLQLFNVIPTAVAAVTVPFLTRLGDIVGYRKILRVVVPLVCIATVIIWVAALTSSWELVLIGRVLHGAIPVWMPIIIALVYAKASGTSAGTFVSLVVAAMTTGTLLGTASSGFVYGALQSLANTVVIIPILQAVCVVLVVFVLPEFVSGADSHIDAKGFIGLAFIMLLAIFGFVEVVEGGVDSLVGAVLIILALGIGVFWYRYQKRIDNPAIDVRVMFTRRLFPLYIAALCYGAVFYGFLSPVATYLAADPAVDGFGYAFGPEGISIAQTVITLCTVLAAVVLPVVLKKIHPKPALLLGFALALVAFVQWTLPGASLVKVGLFVALVGLGIGIIAAAIPVIIPSRATVETRGIATGLFNSAQTLGGALGGGLFVSLLKVGATPAGVITETGYTTVWITCGLFMLIGLVVVTVFLTKDKEPAQGGE